MIKIIPLFLALLLPLSTHAQPKSQPHPEKWVQGRILVSPKAGLPEAQLEKILRSHASKVSRKIGQSDLYLVSVPKGSEMGVANKLKNNPHFKFAELDMEVPLAYSVNDPYYPNAWHLPKIGTPTAWDVAQGTNVVVAILDSGVDSTHPDLAAQLVPGWNFYSNNADTSDVYGHGTKVAGTVAATMNNSLGVSGVAGNARIMPIRVSDSTGMGSWSAIASGLIYAADHGAKVANASFLGLTDSSSTRSAAQYMKDKGGLVIVSGGNTGALQTYAATTSMISVSATDGNDYRASWSSYGDYISLAAPGVGIWTTTAGGGYGAPSGTSFSSPVAAGVIALMMSAAPSLSNTQIESILFSTALDLPPLGRDQYFGYGRVDASKAVYTAYTSAPVGDSQSPSVSISSPTSGASVSGLVPVSVAATDNVGVTRVELRVDSSPVAVDTSSPFAFSWDSTGASNGGHILVAYAFDEAGNTSASNPVTVNVSNSVPAPTPDSLPPVVKITSPVPGKVSKNVTITVNASDNMPASGLSLRIYVDDALQASGTGGTLSTNWNTNPKGVFKGTHYIRAVATDAAGNTSYVQIEVIK